MRMLPLRLALCFILGLLLWTGVAVGSAELVGQEPVTFAGHHVTLNGTIFIPEGTGPHPAVVLVHGAGLGLQDDYHAIAQSFAEEGILALTYDKRTDGYSADPIGSRSYELLARDVVAAVEMLQQRPEVDSARVGVWGLSEGGWVAPLAATYSPEISYVITVAGGGIGPARQTAWSVQEILRRQGVTSTGALRGLADRTYSMLVAMDVFSEGTYDPVPVLKDLQQPILAVWGADDELMPPAASARLMHQVLNESGHEAYTLRIIPDADHEVVTVGAGETTYAPGYIDMMVAWIESTTDGQMSGPVADPLPTDESPVPVVTEPALLLQANVQLWWFAGLQVLLIGYIVMGWVRRRAYGKAPYRRLRRTLCALGLVLTWGVYGMVGAVSITAGTDVGPIVVGRPLVWLVLQILAVLALVITVALGMAWFAGRGVRRRGRGRRGMLLLAGILLVPWAAWWQLFAW